MNLLTTYLKLKLRKFTKNNIRFRAMGRLEELDPKIHELIHYTIEKTKNNTGMILNLALNYSGRIELQDAIYQILETDRKSPLKKEEITDQLISSFLYEPKIPDPDLIIRTSNEFRISNFLLWQSAYSEYYFSEKLWPDFKSNDFMDALDDFFTRDRRYGGVKNAD
jgi:undecaprenyl diphosphate synthase